MRNPFSGIVRKLSGGSLSRKHGKGRLIHLPDDLLDPDGFLVYSGPSEPDVWPAMFITNTLQKEFPDKNLTVLCSGRDNPLFNMLPLRPQVLTYTGHPRMPEVSKADDSGMPDRTIFIYPYTEVKAEDEKVLADSTCGIKMAPITSGPSRNINLIVKTEAISYSGILSQICSVLGLTFDTDFRPVIPDSIQKAAESSIAPVSGRMLPYIVTTSTAISILEKRNAEIPLRTVSLSGRHSDLDHLTRELKTAIIADATAVATDSEEIWADACAHGVPVVGLDTSGNFLKWDDKVPASDETGFREAWIRLLKKGW
jgi:uncharacterized protein (UPF0147 family)